MSRKSLQFKLDQILKDAQAEPMRRSKKRTKPLYVVNEIESHLRTSLEQATAENDRKEASETLIAAAQALDSLSRVVEARDSEPIRMLSKQWQDLAEVIVNQPPESQLTVPVSTSI